MKQVFFALCIATLFAASAKAEMRITEWMYSGGDGEFVEFTNVGSTAIDMAGWSFDDDSENPGTVDLSGFGAVMPGKSVILTDADAAAFDSAWGLSGSVGIIGGNGTNLGRADEINLYDSSDNLVDRLTYDDQSLGKCAHPERQWKSRLCERSRREQRRRLGAFLRGRRVRLLDLERRRRRQSRLLSRARAGVDRLGADWSGGPDRLSPAVAVTVIAQVAGGQQCPPVARR